MLGDRPPSSWQCPDDGLPLHEVLPGVYVCRCAGTLAFRGALHADVRELLESSPPRESEPDVACPRCHGRTSLLRVEHRERWPHWCEPCDAIWFRLADLQALSESRREEERAETEELRSEERQASIRRTLTIPWVELPWWPASKWDPSHAASGYLSGRRDPPAIEAFLVTLINLLG